MNSASESVCIVLAGGLGTRLRAVVSDRPKCLAPIGDRFPNVAAYLERVKRRPSVARVLGEAAPYFAMFPG